MPRTPDTIIQFFNVPWDSGYRNLRYFSSESSRDSYFSSRSHITYPDDFSESVTHAQPVKEGVPYTVRGGWDRWHNYNYMRFKNSAYTTGKWIYCFITSWSYSSEHSATFTFSRDIWVNNVENFIFPNQFIERETTDTVNDLPEPVSVNRYICEEKKPVSLTNNELIYVALASGLPQSGSHMTRTCYMNGTEYPYEMKASLNYSDIDNFIQQYATEGTLDRIISVFALPATMFRIESTMSITGVDATGTLDRHLTGYTPRHSKCYHYPYMYLEVGDYTGNRQIYKWENGFGDEYGTHFEFNLLSVASMSSFAMFQPLDSTNHSHAEGTQMLSHSVHGQIGWTADGFASWIAQNTTQIKAQQEQFIISTGASVVSGAVSGAVGGSMIGGIGSVVGSIGGALIGAGSSIANFAISQNALLNRADYTPNPTSVPDGAILGLLCNAMGGFYYRTVRMSDSELKALDYFFDRYGYNVNRIGSLNITHSPYYFVKTNGATVRGACPQSDRETMMEILDRGVTFWQSDNIGNY